MKPPRSHGCTQPALPRDIGLLCLSNCPFRRGIRPLRGYISAEAAIAQRLNRLRNKDVAGLSEEALGLFMRHDWPGNIRELENAIEHAFILCRQGLIEARCLPEYLHDEPCPVHTGGLTLVDFERSTILNALDRNGWRRMATAREPGIDKNTLRHKMKRLNIVREEAW